MRLPVLACALLTACFQPGLEPSGDPPDDTAVDTDGGSDFADGDPERIVAEGSPEARATLAFLNDPGTDYQLLRIEVDLDARAASALIAHRNGPDTRFETEDDNLFDDIAEVDAVEFIGDEALAAIVDHAVANGYGEDDTDTDAG